MNKTLSFRSSEDIKKNYEDASEQTRKNPVIIVSSGKEDTVLLSFEEYLAQLNYIAELEARLAVSEKMTSSRSLDLAEDGMTHLH